jgi:endonuclease/exonuclease/phosphatase family metal-dependent hydrolase
MMGRIELFFRRWRRRISRSEWAIRLLGLPVSEGTGTEPGLVLIQIDGLSRRQMERAMERGRLPLLKRLRQREQYETRTFYPGLPSSTPAVQGELHYGERCAVPSFSFFDPATRRVFTMLTPEFAKEIETKLAKRGEGLLRGGSSWSNMYRGGASDEESHFCSASMGVRDLFRSRPLVRLITFPAFHAASLVKIVALLAVEIGLAIRDLCHGVAHGESFPQELITVFKRVFICIGLRELLSIGVKIDVARGLPIIHVNFLGYDEQAHRRGPASAYAHWCLAGIDRAIKTIHRAAQRSARRDYQVWVFSDHGQEATRPYEEIGSAGLENAVISAISAREGADREDTPGPVPTERPARSRITGERGAAHGFTEWLQAEVLSLFEEKPFTVTALGPVGHIYFKEIPDLDGKRRLAEALVHNGSIPGVLIGDDAGTVELIHPDGRVSVDVARPPDFLKGPEWLRSELAVDLARLCRHEFSGDLVLLGLVRGRKPVSFVNERGAHGGVGPEETRGFALLPAKTRLPEHVEDVLRPADLREAALHFLKRGAGIPARTLAKPHPSARPLRVMTYNIHGCLGMDGRISPRRVARVIDRYHPDLVALQEVDLGRARSHGHDQARLIADELGMHREFCPTVVENGEQYGNALLSAYPVEVMRKDILASGGQPPGIQPRGALWVRLHLGRRRLNLINTHFGLRRSERCAQATDIVGDGWLGAVGKDEPVILCGDFNMFPKSLPYRTLTARLRDVQGSIPEFTPRKTFSSIRPMVRIDHIFVSPHFLPVGVIVPRNHLTRVASDHLPLVADLNFYEEES